MYYNRDSCTNMLSKDQRARMRACLHSLRSKLAKSSNNNFSAVNSVNFKNLPAGKPALKNKITFFPNPTNGIVHILYHDLAVKKDMNIVVYSQIGQKLREVQSHTAINELNLGSLSEGMYYIAVTIDNATITKYIIKTNSSNLFFAK